MPVGESEVRYSYSVSPMLAAFGNANGEVSELDDAQKKLCGRLCGESV